MGEKSYRIKNTFVTFSEVYDDISCLCTFPHNNEADNFTIEPHQVRSLAYLGAMVCLIHKDRLDGYTHYIPQDLPKWIKDEIDKAISTNDQNEKDIFYNDNWFHDSDMECR